jgi:glycosyltransferase involved in cell wall biosynthesis
MKISYAILACNEAYELDQLIQFLVANKREEDEIVVVTDEGKTTDDVKYVVGTKYKNSIAVWAEHPLNNNFADQKNYLNSICTGDYIFNIDADEGMFVELITNLPAIIEDNSNIDMFLVGRINIVDGLTTEHVKQWGWTVTKNNSFIEERVMDITSPAYKLLFDSGFIIEEHINTALNENTSSIVKYYVPIVNFPDSQMRIYRNKPEIKWVNAVHEVLSGYGSYTHFPLQEQFCLLHIKDIKKQEQQNSFYATI